MRIRVAYARVSTASGEQLSALETQLAWLRLQACDLVLSDVESGRKVERADYQHLRDLIQQGRVAEVVATRLDRLGRVASECDAFVELCDSRSTAVTTRDDGRLTMTTPEDLMLTRLKASMAQGESMKISARVKKAREQGERDARPMRRPCFGYRLSPDKRRMEIDPETGPIALQLLADLRARNWRMYPVLREYQGRIPITSVRGLQHWLQNPVIRGALTYPTAGGQTRIQWDQHEPLMSHEEYQEFESIRSVNRRLWGRNGDRAPRALTGLCVCQDCGNRLRYMRHKRHVYLSCSGVVRCSQSTKSIREDRTLAWATEQLAQKAAERLAAAAVQSEHPEVTALKRQIAALEAQCDPDLEEALERKRLRLESLLSKPQTDVELIRKISDPRWFDTLTYEELTLVLHQVVDHILIARQVPIELALKP
ncbi:MAG: recombinase family protein [Steroidobacteraceae bacterium]